MVPGTALHPPVRGDPRYRDRLQRHLVLVRASVELGVQHQVVRRADEDPLLEALLERRPSLESGSVDPGIVDHLVAVAPDRSYLIGQIDCGISVRVKYTPT